MTLHPQIEEALQKLAAANLPPIHTLSPAEARAQMIAVVRARGSVPEPIRRAEDRTVPGPAGPIPVRLYWPEADGPLPVLVYYHGGGHVIGDLDTHDVICRNLAAGAGALVMAVDYRMGPEHRFPAAVEDCWAALRWIAAEAPALGADPARIAVAGDSAGGNLAAVMALMARDADGLDLRMQVLIYPVADYGLVGESFERFDQGFGPLTRAAMEWFRGHYLRAPADAADWRASPIRAPSLAGLAPAMVVVAGCDVLHDDSVRYAEALRTAGVPVDWRLYPGMIHGFFGMTPMIDDAVAAQRVVTAELRRAFG
ncbi:alpha/beta hydrolase [Stella sp.]|uniref:alpha/beta hydrolase n=1 Tax=Stella sp. TaxID=2912054 RepID=UPI0035B17A4F